MSGMKEAASVFPPDDSIQQMFMEKLWKSDCTTRDNNLLAKIFKRKRTRQKKILGQSLI